MKNILSKVLATSMALTLVLATSTTATAPALKAKRAEVKAHAAAVESKAEAETKSDLGILEAIEEKVSETAQVEVVKTQEAAPAEEAAPTAEAKAERAATVTITDEAAPVEEAAAPAEEAAPTEEEAAPAEEVVKVWDISATEEDSVEMKFVAKTKNVDVKVYEGEVTISGEGAMEEAVYTNFLSVEKYLEAVKAMFEEEYGVTVRLDYDHEIDDVIELDRTLKIYAETANGDVEVGDALVATPEMLEGIDLAQFLEFSPTKITINEGITSVSDCAFVGCADLREIVLPKSIETIGDRAFLYCTSLKRVVIPEDAEIVTGAFYNCFDLDTVVLATDDDYAAEDNFAGQSVKTMPKDQVQRLIDGI